MRQGIACALFEAIPGSLSEVRRSLEAWQFVCRTVAPEADADQYPGRSCSSTSQPAVARPRRRRWQRSGAPAAPRSPCVPPTRPAPCRSQRRGAATTCSPHPSIRSSWCRRLQTLANLHALVRERQRRAELFATYRDGSEATPPGERVQHIVPP